jgi:hypothetical protein
MVKGFGQYQRVIATVAVFQLLAALSGLLRRQRLPRMPHARSTLGQCRDDCRAAGKCHPSNTVSRACVLPQSSRSVFVAATAMLTAGAMSIWSVLASLCLRYPLTAILAPSCPPLDSKPVA